VHENDTEHSYNLAVTAWFLAPHFPELDRDLLIRYGLIHDLVEVHAGDTNVYASDDVIATKHARETAAADKLRKDWSDFPEIHDLIERYEERGDAEARFVYALDKIMPIMQIYINEGHTWKIEGITAAKLHAVKADKVTLSPEIKPYYDELYALLLASPELIPKV
jgi:putative hydrolases of HD superfamily